MCGINGIYAYNYAANPIDRAELIQTRDHMANRGPDGFGAWVSTDQRVGLGHRRLSIIDLSNAAAQPMANKNETSVVTFNGEIYNYKELRQNLEDTGIKFRSDSDTEVLLHLYAAKGHDMVHELRGMFAFALWDSERKGLFLARDPYGIKPLYYADDGWTFRFASQVKALLAGGTISKDPEPAGHAGFYLWGHVPEPFTTYRAIRSLPAGHTAWIDRTGLNAPRSYYSIAATLGADAGRLSRDEIDADIRSSVSASVAAHLTSDVPVGAFLSAGIDSAALVGLMRDANNGETETITLRFEEFQDSADDEAPLAARVANAYGAKHTVRTVAEDEFRSDLPAIFAAMDQPTTDGLNTWFVSKAARELGLKVAFSGLGGDEIFGGYPAFTDVPLWARAMWLPARLPGLGWLSRKALDSAGIASNPKAAGMIELGGTFQGAYLLRRGVFMPWELKKIMDPELAEIGLKRLGVVDAIKKEITPRPASEFATVAALEASLYMRNQLLRDTDWASMAHSLEVRVPLVDHVLLRSLAPIIAAGIGGRGKLALANAPQKPMPSDVVHRAKTGFRTPIATWLQKDYGGRIENHPMLASQRCPWARRWAHIVMAEQSTLPQSSARPLVAA